MRTITAEGGPLDGKTYEIPDTLDQFDGPDPAAGHYTVAEDGATWVDATPVTPPKPKPVAAKSSTRTKPRTATRPADAPDIDHAGLPPAE